MNLIVTASILLLAGGASVAQIISIGQCPEHQVVQNFDVLAYAGEWYELSRYETVNQRGGECVHVNYTLNEDGSVRVENRHLVPPGGQFELAIGRAVISFPDEVPLQGKLNVSFGAMPPTTSNYWVLDTDYTSFSFVWSCFPVSDTIRGENFWLLSRTVDLSASSQSRVDELIDQYLMQRHIRVTQHDLPYCGDQEVTIEPIE
ncbi:apolipoprotein D-like [Topomyia yanbarensis]|uniref:apolipoprotein D-like n=1 Tax=Topomyia yanbarensis TaxID=2498891 RepID=UPI00273C915C|nr:apolipoprotein D-like [Topomyia yanbarensis]